MQAADASGGGPDVFISYASQDAAVAHALVEALEREHIGCWMAPRDVTPGALYADAIVRAISAARCFVVVLSQNSIASSHVGKEIARVCAFRGERDHALEWLERAYVARDEDLYLIKDDPLLKNLEGDPRYHAFLKKMNLLN